MTQKKSKSKTFQRGTDYALVYSWFSSEIGTNDIGTKDITDSKYLITITKIEDKPKEL